MDQWVQILKMALLYLLILVPQLRLVKHKYDPHIGNFTASRVSGKSLKSIFFHHSFGVPIPILSLSIQYDFFKNQLFKYKIAHAIIASAAAPLFYLFANLFIGNEPAAFVASLLYAATFSFPITGSWLIKSEHYENLFFLSGGSLLLASGGSPAWSAAGAALLGLTLLCKLPALISFWLVAVTVFRCYTAGDLLNAGVIAAFYLAPLFIYMLLGKFVAQDESHGPDQARPGGGILGILRDVPSTYLYFYRRDPAGYIAEHVKYCGAFYLRQFLPVVVLASLFLLLGSHPEKQVLEFGLAVVSLIFVIRMGFSFVHSFNILICIAAGMALTLPNHLAGVSAAAVAASACLSFVLSRRDSSFGVYFIASDAVTIYDVLAEHIRETLKSGERMFCNVNKSLAFMYPLSGHALPCHAGLLTIGGYGPRIDHTEVPSLIAREGEKLISALKASPPEMIVQSRSDWPILSLEAIERHCGVSYAVTAVANPFVVYRLAGRRDADAGGIDSSFLFNAEQGLAANNDAAAAFINRLDRLEHLAAVKESAAYHAPEPTPASKENEPMPTEPSVRPEPQGGIIFLDTYYPAFLEKLYAAHPSLAGDSYEAQKSALISARFGDSDYYSHGLRLAGYQADDLIVNSPQLQLTWCRENGVEASELRAVALEQVKRLRPAVVYLQDVGMATAEFVQELRETAGLVVAQHACPVPPQVDFSWFDIVFTAVPYLADDFRRAGTAAYYVPLAFDPRVNSSFTPYQRRVIDVSFVGGFSGAHAGSYPLLDHLARTTPILFWGYGTGGLPEDSAIHARYQGEAWGQEMMKLFANSRITVNRHIDMARNYACNMRLFEATGNGALLITDYKENLDQLFEIGKEVVAYRTPEECAALVQYYLAHPEEAEAIARAGQARTLRDHTYAKRMERTGIILQRHLRYRREHDRFAAPASSAVSCGYSAISQEEVSPAMTSAWQSEEIPARQRGLVQRSLAGMYRGEEMPEYRILAEVMKPHVLPGCSVLELGCSSGYVYEILEYYLKMQLRYTGVDYSEAMISMAKDYYPEVAFFAADGAHLHFADRQFHMVISSGILLHVPNYRDHILETARVAQNFVVASRTPICKQRPTQYLKKFAYDVETVELVFNEEELLREFAANRFELLQTVEYGADPSADMYVSTYIFRRS